MRPTIPAFTDSEIWVVSTALKERFGDALPELEQVESDVRLNPDDRDLTICPALYWQAGGAHFVLCKTGDNRYRSMFFYRIRERYTTDREEYDDLAECVSVLLKLQADQEKERVGVGSGKTGAELE